MPDGIFDVPRPANEPVRQYAPGSPERESLERTLRTMAEERLEIPALIGGREVRTGNLGKIVCPHDHGHELAIYHQCGASEVEQAVAAADEAWREWSELPWPDRAAVFLRSADLLAGPWRDRLNAASMLGQSKTCIQAEIDAACELVDFWRFNVRFADQLYRQQPESAAGVWNRTDYRPLEGFVFAVTPFNFTSIGGNLPTAPAIMGNVSLWKPASTAVLSNYYVMKLLQAAGLPDGVVNFVPGRGGQVGDPVLASGRLAGIHFTGSTSTFQGMWSTIGHNIATYGGYPRIVGETGGKDFVFAHPSAEIEALAVALGRGAFEYQGQKCSAASRAYIPKSLWPELRDRLVALIGDIRMGTPTDFRSFMAAVIDRKAFDSITGYVDEANAGAPYEVLAGGGYDGSEGYFVEPTLVLTDDPKARLMREEIFGPVLTVFVYDDAQLDEALGLCDTTSDYALTGAVFAEDRRAIAAMSAKLRHTAGNFYVNDKPTGAVVGQQPFGGGRASGTNDKAGSIYNLMRWVSMRTVKETFVPSREWRYPHMNEV